MDGIGIGTGSPSVQCILGELRYGCIARRKAFNSLAGGCRKRPSHFLTPLTSVCHFNSKRITFKQSILSENGRIKHLSVRGGIVSYLTLA